MWFYRFAIFLLLGSLCTNFQVVAGSTTAASFNTPSSESTNAHHIDSRDISESVDEYRIGPNDVLNISVYGEDGLTQEFRVSSTGYLTFPLLGRFKVAGMSVETLQDYVRNALAKDYIRDPQVNVFMKEFSNIYVFGEVHQPGPYLFKGGMTVLRAITTAGGFTKVANKKNVRIVRNHGDKRQTIDVNANNISKGNEEDVVLKPGDTIVVSESFF